MAPNAVFWIRDGVLVDRMHINPVAFAFSTFAFAPIEKRKNSLLEELINFGFEKSGYSCADKIRLYNVERAHLVDNIDNAAAFYNAVATEAALSTDYFPGVEELVSDLTEAGCHNFITSAVEQEVLNAWSRSEQGQRIARSLKEILGQRDGFTKGRDHFAYVSEKHGAERIFYVADAVLEIQTGNGHSSEFNITPVGFGNVITVERVMEAVCIASNAASACDASKVPYPISFPSVDEKKIQLPDSETISSSLTAAGAHTVVSGTKDSIMEDLRNYFESCGCFDSLKTRKLTP
ncbi:MAG: hypothetical protein K2X93_19225 [Candidatus Obscuribacterales bacterium]|nr:hypothetical protein [Candidatus Obscuribacterales bacterium]